MGIPCEELKDAKEGAVMDVFFTVHTKPFPQECQKFTCDKFNEGNASMKPMPCHHSSTSALAIDCAAAVCWASSVNLVYHPWCFRGKDVSYSTVLEAKARMYVRSTSVLASR